MTWSHKRSGNSRSCEDARGSAKRFEKRSAPRLGVKVGVEHHGGVIASSPTDRLSGSSTNGGSHLPTASERSHRTVALELVLLTCWGRRCQRGIPD